MIYVPEVPAPPRAPQNLNKIVPTEIELVATHQRGADPEHSARVYFDDENWLSIFDRVFVGAVQRLQCVETADLIDSAR